MKRRMGNFACFVVWGLTALTLMPKQSDGAVVNGVDYDSSVAYDATDNSQPDGQWSYGKYNGIADWASFSALPETNFYTSGVGGDEIPGRIPVAHIPKSANSSSIRTTLKWRLSAGRVISAERLRLTTMYLVLTAQSKTSIS